MTAKVIATLVHPRRWGLFASSRQCIVVLTFDTIEAADWYRAHPDTPIHIDVARYREARQ